MADRDSDLRIEEGPFGQRVVERDTTYGPDGRPLATHEREIFQDRTLPSRRDHGAPTTEVRRVSRRPRRILREHRTVYPAWGLARSCGAVLGTAFAALAAGNLYYASAGGGGSFAGIPVHGSAVIGVLHAVVALFLVAAACIPERTARGPVAAAGILLGIGAILGAALPQRMGDALQLGGGFPDALVALYGIAAAGCLLCALLPTPRRRQVLERDVTRAEPAGSTTTVEGDGTVVLER